MDGAFLLAMAEDKLPADVLNAVLRASHLPEGNKNLVVGYDFNNGLDLGALLRSLHSTGFQAAHLGQAIVEVNRMVGVPLSISLDFSHRFYSSSFHYLIGFQYYRSFV